jgi:Mrp family chromosome partitioning ATPase
VEVGPVPGDYAAAAEIARAGADVVLVARAGATRRDDLASAAARLREVDARITGVVLVAKDRGQAAAAWR